MTLTFCLNVDTGILVYFSGLTVSLSHMCGICCRLNVFIVHYGLSVYLFIVFSSLLFKKK